MPARVVGRPALGAALTAGAEGEGVFLGDMLLANTKIQDEPCVVLIS